MPGRPAAPGMAQARPTMQNQAAASGGRAGKVPPLAEMLREYYQVRGWDTNGVPTDETLEGLGLTR